MSTQMDENYVWWKNTLELHAEMSEIAPIWYLGILSGSSASLEKYLSSKQSPLISPNDLKTDGAKLFLSKQFSLDKLICIYVTS